MTLLENVIMVIVLTIAMVMFYNTVIFVSDVKTDIKDMNNLKLISKTLDKDVYDVYCSDTDNFVTNLNTYIMQIESDKKVSIDYTIVENGVYLKLSEIGSGLQFNMFKTLGIANE